MHMNIMEHNSLELESNQLLEPKFGFGSLDTGQVSGTFIDVE